MRSLNIYGCGKVGMTLGALLLKRGLASPASILTRSIESAECAVHYIGAGRAITNLSNCSSADIHLITTTDDQIKHIVSEISDHNIIREGDVVFHCSGSISSTVLNPLKEQGAFPCSIHPIKSFAVVDDAVKTFDGTYCAIEGEPESVQVVTSLFDGIGAKLITVDTEQKVLYHAANVLVCNNLTALLETGLQVYESAGIDWGLATEIITPIVRETVENTLKYGPEKSLTGPVSRGDSHLVSRQLCLLGKVNPTAADVYEALGRVALQLTESRGQLPESKMNQLREVFNV